jgi:hypothetical protein
VRREPKASDSGGRTPEATRSSRIREILDDLIRQRQSLRLAGNVEEPGLLEANRRSILYWQAELARVLVAEHGRREAAA